MRCHPGRQHSALLIQIEKEVEVSVKMRSKSRGKMRILHGIPNSNIPFSKDQKDSSTESRAFVCLRDEILDS